MSHGGGALGILFCIWLLCVLSGLAWDAMCIAAGERVLRMVEDRACDVGNQYSMKAEEVIAMIALSCLKILCHFIPCARSFMRR